MAVAKIFPDATPENSGPERYVSDTPLPYEHTGESEFRTVKVLENLDGKDWDDEAISYVHSLRPTELWVIKGGETDTSGVKPSLGRVTVKLDDDGKIEGVTQEVEFLGTDGKAPIDDDYVAPDNDEDEGEDGDEDEKEDVDFFSSPRPSPSKKSNRPRSKVKLPESTNPHVKFPNGGDTPTTITDGESGGLVEG